MPSANKNRLSKIILFEVRQFKVANSANYGWQLLLLLCYFRLPPHGQCRFSSQPCQIYSLHRS